jgi:hypothetical protein
LLRLDIIRGPLAKEDIIAFLHFKRVDCLLLPSLKIVRRRNFSCKLSLLDVFWNNLLFGLEQEEEDLFVVVECWELVDEVAVQK